MMDISEGAMIIMLLAGWLAGYRVFSPPSPCPCPCPCSLKHDNLIFGNFSRVVTHTHTRSN